MGKIDVYNGIYVGGHRLYVTTIPPLGDQIGEESKFIQFDLVNV